VQHEEAGWTGGHVTDDEHGGWWKDGEWLSLVSLPGPSADMPVAAASDLSYDRPPRVAPGPTARESKLFGRHERAGCRWCLCERGSDAVSTVIISPPSSMKLTHARESGMTRTLPP
jgi:hypothetical protein